MKQSLVHPKRADGTPSPNYIIAECECGWRGVLTSLRTVEGRTLAQRDADDHNFKHIRVAAGE